MSEFFSLLMYAAVALLLFGGLVIGLRAAFCSLGACRSSWQTRNFIKSGLILVGLVVGVGLAALLFAHAHQFA